MCVDTCMDDIETNLETSIEALKPEILPAETPAWLRRDPPRQLQKKIGNIKNQLVDLVKGEDLNLAYSVIVSAMGSDNQKERLEAAKYFITTFGGRLGDTEPEKQDVKITVNSNLTLDEQKALQSALLKIKPE